MWDDINERLALLELVVQRCLRKRNIQKNVYEHLKDLPWTKQGRRRNEIVLVEHFRPKIEELLYRVWGNWKLEYEALLELELTPTPDDWGVYMDQKRIAQLPVLPHRLNKKTITSLIRGNSKLELNDEHLQSLGDVDIVDDGDGDGYDNGDHMMVVKMPTMMETTTIMVLIVVVLYW